MRPNNHDELPTLMEVSKVDLPEDNIPRVTLSNLHGDDPSKPLNERYQETPDGDYLLTVESLMDAAHQSIKHDDLQIKSIKAHGFNGCSATVLVEWNSGDESWESVNDMKTHGIQHLMEYARKHGLQHTLGWRWSQVAEIHSRRIQTKLKGMKHTEYGEAILRRAANRVAMEISNK